MILLKVSLGARSFRSVTDTRRSLNCSPEVQSGLRVKVRIVFDSGRLRSELAGGKPALTADEAAGLARSMPPLLPFGSTCATGMHT